MNATEIITILYGMVGIIGSIGFLPQIIHLIKNNTCEGISIKTWLIWTYCSTISIIYALSQTSDHVFQFVTGVNFIGTAIILALALYHKTTKPDV